MAPTRSAGALPSELLHLDARLLTGRTAAHVDRAVAEALLARGDPARDAEEVGVRELLARAGLAIVEEDAAASPLERRCRPLGDLLRADERHDVVVERRNRLGPHDALLVVVLFDHRCHRPRRADPVAAHHDRMLPARLVQVRCLERHRVIGAQFEDVPNLDRRLDVEPSSAPRAGVPLLDLPEVGPGAGLPVAARLGPDEVPAVAVRPGHVLPLTEELVGPDLAREPGRAGRAPAPPERSADPLRV